MIPTVLDHARNQVQELQRAIVAPREEGATEPVPEGKVETEKVGILFVHGIGTELPGVILDSWAGPIITSLAAWQQTNSQSISGTWVDRNGQVVDPVVRSEIDFNGGSQSIIEIKVPRFEHEVDGVRRVYLEQLWVMTEAWWATTLSPPNLSAVIDWTSRQGVFGSVVTGIIENGAGSGGAGSVIARFGLGLFLSLVSSVALLGYLFLRAIAAIIPIQAVKDAAVFHQIDSFLLTWWGDVYQLLRDPAQSANVRGRIYAAAEALRAYGCASIVVIAHSGGTVASFMTLGDPTNPVWGRETPSGSNPAHPRPRITKLITHGEAINLVRPLSPGIYETEGAGTPINPSGIAARLRAPIAWKGRWVDFWATHDPAPNGPLTPESDSGGPDFVSREVWNRRSIREDHGGYWANEEEFVRPLLRELDTPLGSDAESRFAEPPCPEVDSRHQRVHALTMWRRIAFAAPFVGIVLAFFAGGRDSGFQSLIDIAKAVWPAIPGTTDIGNAFAPLQAEKLGNLKDDRIDQLILAIHNIASATLLAVVLGLAVHAVLPVRRGRVWLDRPIVYVGMLLLDWLPLVIMVLVIYLFAGPAITSAQPGTPTGQEYLWAFVGAGVLLLLILLRLATEEGTVTGLASIAIVFAAAIAIVSTLLAFIIFADVREWIVGAILSFLLFRPLVGYGAVRWERWDATERDAVRRSAQRPGRGRVFTIAILLLFLAVITALGIAFGSVRWPSIGQIWYLLVGIGVFVALMVVLALDDAREASRPVPV
jgi:hypothetical protein